MSNLDFLRNDMEQNLSAALDLGKIMNVFNTFVGIIKDQQVKLDRADEEIRDLKDKMSKLNAQQLANLEKKLDDFIVEIKGGGDMDKSVLHADISPFDAFHPTNPIIAPIIEDEEEDDNSTVESSRSPIRLPRLEEENSVASLDRDSIHEEKKDKNIDDLGSIDTNNDEKDLSPVPSIAVPTESVSTPLATKLPSEKASPRDNSSPAVQDHESEAAVPAEGSPLSLEMPDPSPVSTKLTVEVIVEKETEKSVSNPASARVTPLLAELPTQDQPSNMSPFISHSPSTDDAATPSLTNSGRPMSSRPISARPNRAASIDSGLPPRSARSYSILVNNEQHDGEHPILDEISSTLPMVIEALKRSGSRPVSGRSMSLIRPMSASTSTMAGIALTGGASRPLSGLNSGRKHNPIAVRRRMDAARLPWLTPHRAKRFLTALQLRGRFILISRKIMDESRKKYGAASLKNRIDVLEADLLRVNGRLETMKDTMKRQHAAVKELVSPDVNKLLEEIGKLVKGVHSNLGTMDNFLKIIFTLKDTDFSLFSSAGRDEMMQEFSEKLQQTLLKDMKDQLELKFAMMSKEYVSRQDVLNMLRQGSAFEQNMDHMHLKLLQLIDRTVKPPLETLDALRMESEKKLQEKMFSQQQELLTTLDARQIEAQQAMEERMRYVNQQMQHLAKKAEGNDHVDDELAILKTKLKKLEDEREALQVAREKEAQQRQAEHEALKILQRRLANISIDKLMDELKDVRDEIKDRPSTHQVEHMVGKIEKTFKSHLGENVNGLTNLVGQVYKYLQTKVDRDDIRNLIASKLMQMEQELIYREEEMLTAAGTSSNAPRCISCGQLPVVSRPRTSQRSAITSPQTKLVDDAFETSQPHPTSAASGSLSPSMIVTPSPLNNGSAYSLPNNEQVYSLLTGQVGLRPLHLQHNPLQPRDPFNGTHSNNTTIHSSRPHTMSTNRVKPITSEKIPEPLYRKARMAAHLKEMVKVASPSLDSYGYQNGTNPFYVTDTPSSLPTTSAGGHNRLLFQQQSAESQPSLATLHNTFGSNNTNNNQLYSNTAPLRGAGAHIIGSQSLTSLPSSAPHTLDQPHSLSSHSSHGKGSDHHHNSSNHLSNYPSSSGRRVSAVTIDSHNLADVNRSTAF